MEGLFLNKDPFGENKDLKNKNLKSYLNMTRDFKSTFPEFVVKDVHGFNVIDESESCSVGFKARAAEFFMHKMVEQGVRELVYVQPRCGFAGISLSYLCKKFDIDLTLVMPSSKKASPHQLYCIEQGAKPLFIRIASMPNANRAAKIYAEECGAYFVPLGLQHKYVTAGAVRAFHNFFDGYEHPKRMWSVISTGVLTRAMQIALPDTEFHAVAVSRNIQPGELGRAKFYSYHKPFTSKSEYIPNFNCEPTYDSKGWHYMQRYGQKGDWFFSVAGEAPEPSIFPEDIDSYRDWGDKRDFDQYGIQI